MKRCVIIQPMFFPWRGQYDLQSRADVVILLDTVQWVHHHWYNRNLIHGSNGAQWITVPVCHSGHLESTIRDIRIDETKRTWRRRMLESLRQNYGKAPCFYDVFPDIQAVIETPFTRMADLAEVSLRTGFDVLGREVTTVWASSLAIGETDPIQRLVRLCQHVGATHYLSGPAAKAYIGESTAFADAGIELEWMSYAYPAYPQQRPYRERELSILDLLFNTGAEAHRYLWPDGHPIDRQN